jgi:NADP-dependent 3-hydroxy acid dehydrogenase YdfG
MNTNTLNTFNLSGSIALVTGASKGMGRFLASRLTILIMNGLQLIAWPVDNKPNNIRCWPER